MIKFNRLWSCLTLLLLVMFLMSCNKEQPNNAKEENQIQFRTNTTIGTKSIEWLDSFRQNIYSNNDEFYAIGDALEGLNTILNVYLTNSFDSFDQYEISEKEYILNSNNGNINSTELRQFYDNLVNDIAENMSASNLTHRKLYNVIVEQKETSNANVSFNVKTILDMPNNEGISNVYSVTPDPDCPISVNENECYYTGYGDKNNKDGFGLIGGGKCNGAWVNKTAAHEFVQTVISNQIPRGGNSDPKSGTSYDIKYVNQKCWGIVPILYTGQEFQNCHPILSVPDSEVPPTLYNAQDLSCAICIIKDIINSYIYEPNELSFINLYTDKTSILGNDLYWVAEICWGEPIVVPHQFGLDLNLTEEIEDPVKLISTSLATKLNL